MFKSLLRNFVIYTLSLYITSLISSGLRIHGGYTTIIIGGVALTVMFLVLKPILSVLTFPLHIVTLGLFSAFTNALILYLLTIFVPNISIQAFTTTQSAIAGFIIPSIKFNTFFAFIFTAVVLSGFSGIIRWISKE